jgi:valyl-tRNA synthetase
MELAKAYDPRSAEEHHYKRWEENGFFAPEINQDPNATKYSIVIPPPNVTGSLHMGHALQHTIMDALTRWKRMQGYRTLWLPGTDHAGISVQRKVVEQLKKVEHKRPSDIGREEFVRRAWAWKEEYGNTITEQMRREGASVDWSRQRFTMDPELSLAVRNVFCTLYDEGSIYRGLRIVNWCPKDRTVLSDLEVKDEPKKDGKLYFLRYPLAATQEPGSVPGDEFLVVATTRPETMLGDTAVAVNPSDERYKDLIGKTIRLPLTNREIPIIGDDYVDAEFGTGAVKITPAHDPNDYQIGQRHDLPQLLIMNDDATMNAAAGPEFEGLDRFAAREKVVESFEALGLLEKVEDYEITLPICERCKTIVEPILSDQWFVKMDEMRDLALDLARESIPHFSPEIPHQKVYREWLENLKDWTISRQLWWGHQIPAWYDTDGNVFVARTADEAAAKAGGRELTQDQDVLDTWFSSGLWAFSTFGWTGEARSIFPGTQATSPASVRLRDAGGLVDQATHAGGTGVAGEDTRTPGDLETFLPTDVLVTGRDIIFLWVSRMMMLTKKFVDKVAFDDVVVTGTVLGKDGKPMSKTRGNGVDPLEMFDKFGVDATRIYLASIATGADIKWNDIGVETYRNFANKIWNATRFCLMNAESAVAEDNEGGISTGRESAQLDNLVDRWIFSRLSKTAVAVNRALETYQFHEAVSLLYHFFWNDFCDWYIELKKDQITAGDAASLTRIIWILDSALRMLHPFMPYLTEELWLKLPGSSSDLHNAAYTHAEATIMLADFPRGNADLFDDVAESEMASVIDLIKKVRNIRAEMNISPSIKFTVHAAAAAEVQKVFRANEAQILKLARAETLIIADVLEVPQASAKAVTNDAAIAVPLEGLIDFDVERTRLANQIAKLTEEKTRLDAQLSNANFVEKAPAEKVDALRERQSELESQVATLRNNLEALN